MKSQMLYAPVLLLALSTACGKADSNKSQRDLAIEQIQANHRKASEIIADVTVARPNPVADEVTPPPPVVTPPVTGPEAPAAPVAAQPAPVVTPPGLNVEPAPNAPAPAPEGSENEAPGSILTGVPEIDAICKASFKGLESLINGDQAGFEALKLSVEANDTCFQTIAVSTGSLFAEIEALGKPFTFTLGGQRVTFSAKTWPAYAGNPNLVPVFMDIAGSYIVADRNDNLADATERLEYIKVSIEEIEAKDPVTLSDEDAQNLRVLKSSLTVQQKMVGEISARIQYLTAVINFMDLGLNVATVSEIIGQAPSAPAAQPAPANPATPGPGTGNVPGSNEPNVPANGPENPPESPAPEPEPTPAPVPVPDPAPAPAPIPTV